MPERPAREKGRHVAVDSSVRTQQRRRMYRHMAALERDDRALKAAAASQEAESEATVTIFRNVTARTAKCDVCNGRNAVGMTRCGDCSWQSCHACTVAQGCQRAHSNGGAKHIGPTTAEALVYLPAETAKVPRKRKASKKSSKAPPSAPAGYVEASSLLNTEDSATMYANDPAKESETDETHRAKRPKTRDSSTSSMDLVNLLNPTEPEAKESESVTSDVYQAASIIYDFSRQAFQEAGYLYPTHADDGTIILTAPEGSMLPTVQVGLSQDGSVHYETYPNASRSGESHATPRHPYPQATIEENPFDEDQTEEEPQSQTDMDIDMENIDPRLFGQPGLWPLGN